MRSTIPTLVVLLAMGACQEGGASKDTGAVDGDPSMTRPTGDTPTTVGSPTYVGTGTTDDGPETADITDAVETTDPDETPDCPDEDPTNGIDDDCDGEVDEPVIVLTEPVTVSEHSHTARMLSCDAGNLFLPDNSNDEIIVVDIATNLITGTLPTGDYPYFVVSKDGWTVSSNVYDNTVTIIDSASATVFDQLKVGEFPWGITILDDLLYVNFGTAAEPYVLPAELATGTKLERFDGDSGPDRMAAIDGKVFLINARSPVADYDDAVSIHASTGELLGRVETGGGLYDIVSHDANGMVYATAGADEQVIELDPATLSETRRFPTGSAPNGMASRGDYLFVVNRDGPSITVIEPVADWHIELDLSAFQTSINTPRGIAACEGGHLYVEADGKVVGFVDAFED